MKQKTILIIILIAALVLVLAFTAHADIDINEDQELNAYLGIEKLAYIQKLTYLSVLAAVDYKWSVDNIVSTHRYQEQNPVLQTYPSRTDLLVFGGAALACAWAFTRYFPESTLKRVIIDSVVATENKNVQENRDLGLYAARGKRSRAIPIMLVFSTGF